MYKIELKRSAYKELERLPKHSVKRISEAIESLSAKPRPEGCKKLKGIKEDLWRIRVSDYRIIYSIEDVLRIIEIRRIGHRKDIYD